VAIDPWRIQPAQAIADHRNDAADDPASPRGTPCDNGKNPDPRYLFLAEPEMIGHAALLVLESSDSGYVQRRRKLTGSEPKTAAGRNLR